MPYLGGTELANKFISKYSSKRILLDIYSDEWVLNNKNIQGMNLEEFKKYDKEYGSEYRGHLLLVLCDRYNEEFTEELIDVFPQYKGRLRKYSEDIYFDPNFILINLATQKMLAIGLGKKSRLFMTDVLTEKSVSFNDPNDVSGVALFGTQDTKYLENFLKLDHAKIISKFLTTLIELGYFIFTQEDDLTGHQYQSLRDADPNSDGLFEIDGDTYTQEEKDELIEMFEYYENIIVEKKDFISRFFPKIEFEFAYNY